MKLFGVRCIWFFYSVVTLAQIRPTCSRSVSGFLHARSRAFLKFGSLLMLVDGFARLYVQAETLRGKRSHSMQLAAECQREAHAQISFRETCSVDACHKCFFLALDVSVPCIGTSSCT